MNRFPLSLIFAFAFVAVCHAEPDYPRPAESLPREGVPKGSVEKFVFEESEIFPGTVRDIHLYIPANLGDQKAAVMVLQDGPKYLRQGGPWHLATVMDNLIHEGAMPPTVAVCVAPGVTPAGGGSGATDGQSRFNRSFEYDSVSPRYAEFLIEEVLPWVNEKVAITDDPNLTAIGGSSSGAVAAFGAAWHRPDRFRRVFSTIGTYVGLRGGHNYPVLIRHHEPKPLRVFLQDGDNDLNIYGGDWFNANTAMLSALAWGRYEVRHEWGTGGHNAKHGAALLPAAMRWLWQDWQTPIATPSVKDHPEWSHWLIEGQSWRVVTDEVDADIFDPPWQPNFAGEIEADAWTVTPDRQFVITAHNDKRHTVSHQIIDGKTLRHSQPFGYLFVPQDRLETGVTAATMTDEGEAIFATAAGIQCFDQPGRVHLIIDPPASDQVPTRDRVVDQMRLVGNQLLVRVGDVIYARTLAVNGVGEKLITPPKPRL